MTMHAGYCDQFGQGAPTSGVAGRSLYSPYADYASFFEEVWIAPSPASTTTTASVQ
jgi:hypothetical protein